jgi:hypothetical protein
MILYIISLDYINEGHTEPLAVFDTLEQAEQWCKDHPDEATLHYNRITELELNVFKVKNC